MSILTVRVDGGDQVDIRLEGIARRLSRGGALKVGFLRGAVYPGKQKLPVAQVAVWNEFGTEHSPPRPFMRNTIAREASRWGSFVARVAPAVNYDSNVILGLMGERVVGQIQKTINEFRDPPNAPSTVQRKGYDAPLRETKHMLRSVAYEVTHGA